MEKQDLSALDQEELEDARKKGSLLFRLWTEARIRYQEQRDLKEASSASPEGSSTPAESVEAPAPPSEDLMPTDGNFLQKLRTWPRNSDHLPYVVLPPKELVVLSDGQTAESEAKSPEVPPAAPAELAQAEPDDSPVLYSSFMLDGMEPSADQRTFLKRLQTEAAKRYKDYTTLRPGGIPPVLDALYCIGVAPDNYSAFLMVLPPYNGGADITVEGICTALARVGVTSGLQDELIASVVAQRQYFLLFTAALGTPCVNGQDGRIIDHFNRVQRIRLVERDDSTVDYKDLNWLQRVNAGDVICELTPPTEAQDGCTVQGRVITGRQGKRPPLPNGKNTELSEDETLLLATIDGQITFSNQRFNVEQLLVVNTDLGPETGNLDIIGNVVIKGNVLEGFSVHATGDIAISGMAEGATVSAGGSIQVGMGMNGNSRGTLTAKGDIVAKYLENCTATAGGCIRSDNIINCTICCDDRVLVTTGRGVIIGGNITALNAIETNAIGNRSNRATVITLGSTPAFLLKKIELESTIKDFQQTQAEHTKNLAYLAKKADSSPASQQLETDIKVRMSALKLRLAALEKEYKAIVEKQLDMTGCHIYCKMLFPPTHITFGAASVIVRELIEFCNVYYHEGEIRFGAHR